eukprot:1585920-Amphidinium_carterae.1
MNQSHTPGLLLWRNPKLSRFFCCIISPGYGRSLYLAIDAKQSRPNYSSACRSDSSLRSHIHHTSLSLGNL